MLESTYALGTFCGAGLTHVQAQAQAEPTNSSQLFLCETGHRYFSICASRLSAGL
ncbi:hypothetical protein K437DRAFT_254639 [Tilletiaria anomala UBC 951]|uniref:Uncharacterized protein n=1 Tax=Tilletiaria anomala (strain ATCC 24038 / CBS 436.72 / UBC 951) TaxID=1037660 RepID=A0A066WM56_TILAU|nr:uncharacterized protein K437DRAFT_254639 [Tilletiaria anomala UBC 951]KDN52084.1 hypothetical protein K437DRAFT_254639 [Tilletiaria anomala UBC 951]